MFADGAHCKPRPIIDDHNGKKDKLIYTVDNKYSISTDFVRMYVNTWNG